MAEEEEETFDLAKLRKMEEAKNSPNPYFQLPIEEYKMFSSKKSRVMQQQTTGAVPIVNYSKYIVFKACEQKDESILEKRPSTDVQDTGLYFKFNCSNEIKLVKQTLEDVGFVNIAQINH